MSKTTVVIPAPVADVEFWKKQWEVSNIFWHDEGVHQQLINHVDKLLAMPSASKKIFVPLCGKTRDIGYLLSKGFQVFGIEGVKLPIEELDRENNFELKFNESSSIYHTDDNQLQIFCGDMFNCPIEKWGPFDCIWDRASFCAIDYDDRSKYLDIMKRSVRISPSKYGKFAYLFEAVRYDKQLYPGPPRSVSEEDIQKYFADWVNVELLKIGPLDPHFNERLEGIPSQSITYMFTTKS